MRRVEPIQVAYVAVGIVSGAVLLIPFGGWPAALLLGAPLGAMAGLAFALSYC